MERKTDLENVKNVAKWLLNIPVIETPLSPMIVSHPFTKSGIISFPTENGFMSLDITASEEAFQKWTSILEKQIDACRNVNQIFYLVNDSYSLLFVRKASKFLSVEEFSELLGEAWVHSDYANEDDNVTKKELTQMFKTADKKALMTESELETFENLADTFVVYRGVASKNKSKTQAFSWTTNFDKADWFAKRWGNGVVYAGAVSKADVFAYFGRAKEDEVVVDFKKLQNVRVVTEPQPKPESPSSEME